MQSNRVECKPTMWFIGRAVIMSLMFLGFGAYFFYDGAIGYPQKNLEHFMHRAFVKAGQVSNSDVHDNGADPATWAAPGTPQKAEFPQEYAIPEHIDRQNTAWPAILEDYELMKAQGKGWNAAWVDYSGSMKYPVKPAEHPYDEGKVFEQWVAGGVCMALGAYCLFILFRTMGRKMVLESDVVTAAGKTFKVDDVVRVDLRRWKMKGLAHMILKPEYGGLKIRIDGLTYGGFKEEDKPNTAEDLMQGFLAQYHGEVLDYEEDAEEDAHNEDGADGTTAEESK